MSQRITIADTRKCGFCHRGVKRFLEKHGFDWKQFKREGIEIEELESIDDAMAKTVIETVKNG